MSAKSKAEVRSPQTARRHGEMREGTAADVLRYVDGVLLVDLWDELVLPRAVRAAW
jgi:hypothetical protein